MPPPLTGPRPPTGNPGSATVITHVNRGFSKFQVPRQTGRLVDWQCTIPVPVIVLCLSAIFVRNINSSELHFQSVALRSQYSDHVPEAVTLQWVEPIEIHKAINQ